jgi:Fe-S-cluster containining protein
VSECDKCPGYCCISKGNLHTPLTREDIVRIANHLQIPVSDFITRFMTLTNGNVRYIDAPLAIAHFKLTCPFLRQGVCGVNNVKPQACRDLPVMPTVDGVTCSMWYKARLGLNLVTKDNEDKEEITIRPTTAEVVL